MTDKDRELRKKLAELGEAAMLELQRRGVPIDEEKLKFLRKAREEAQAEEKKK